MSEANNVWRVEVDGTEHEIEFEHHSVFKEKVTIRVDGQVVVDDSGWRTHKQKEFQVGGEPATIKIDEKYMGLAHGSTLHVGGRYVEPLQA